MYKKLAVVLFVLVAAMPSFAQGYHFVYVQADGQQPFYIKYNGKNYSSSSIGYLILPKLGDGDFTVQIGFPKNLYPEQTFNLSIAGKDYGYALKNFADKEWGLFNFQTTDIVMNVNNAAAVAPVAQQVVTTNKSNPFGNMLADAIDDSTLNQQRVETKDTITKAATSAVVTVQKNTSSVADSSNSNMVQTTSPTPNTTAAGMVDNTMKKYIITDSAGQNKSAIGSPDNIVKSAENTTSNGTDLTFLDNAGRDTIHAFIPSTDTVSIEKKAAMADSAKSKVDNPFFNNSNTANVSPQMPSTSDTAAGSTITASAITNSNCQAMLSTYDVDKLKKKLTKLDNQDEMLAAIRKATHGKCMTTEQVKDFGNLFLSDENRYGFYDAVYPFVSDYFNFPQLQSTLIDTYYKNRFKALLR